MSTEAMKMALEALVEVTGWTWTAPMRVMDEVEDAITSLRKAIQEEALRNVQRIGQEIEQEPVAWGVHDQIALNKTLETHPQPKREWVGLTDEEIHDAVKACNTTDTYKYFRAIEAKLKEKNNG